MWRFPTVCVEALCRTVRLASVLVPDRPLESAVARVAVDVMLKSEVLDPQGQAVLGAIKRLGHSQVRSVRQGKHFEIELEDPLDDEAVARVKEIAATLLSNPVIEDYVVRVD